jgi:hypothetical protein
MKILFAILLTLTLNACAKAPPSLPVAQFQLIDADTMKPIEGGWINFPWHGKPSKLGYSSCVRGVLGRTGPDGWFRDTARESFWKPDPIPNIFIPGYEYFKYRYGEPDEQHVTAYVDMDRTEVGRYPAWEEKLKKLGYTWQPHEWTKVYPATGFRDTRSAPDDDKIYFVRYRSLPYQVEQNFIYVGKVCSDPGSENIGLESSIVKATDRMRAVESSKYFCREEWKTLNTPFDVTNWFTRATWLLADPTKAFDEVKSVLPDFTNNQNWTFRYTRSLTADEHAAYCRWISSHLMEGMSHEK